MEVTQQRIASEMRTEREALVAYLEGLPQAAWDKASLCEGWTVRDVVCHLVGNAKDLADQNVVDAGSEAYNQRQIDERAGRTPAELLAEWAVEGPRFEEGLLALADDFWNAPYPPFGTVGQALQRLVEDIWVHGQDIRIALGDDPVDGPGVRATLEVVAREVPLRFPDRAADVGGVAIRAGDVQETVTLGDGPTITVTGEPIAVALAATGRTGLDTISIEPSPPEGFASAFNIYAP